MSHQSGTQILLSRDDAIDVIVRSALREGVVDSIAWIAEGHPLSEDVQAELLLEALCAWPDSDDFIDSARRRIARQVTMSYVDTAALLPEAFPHPSVAELHEVLELLATKCSTGSLSSLDSEAVVAARRENPLTVNVLCACVGLSYEDLRMRVGDVIPARADDHWTPAQVRKAFSVIDAIVQGKEHADIAGTVPVRPIEFSGGYVENGWQAIDRMFRHGVPYEYLIAQRIVGDSWRQSTKNQVSGIITSQLASQLADEISASRLSVKLSSRYGGESSAREMAAASGVPAPALLVLDRSEAVHAVVISMARDGGTARKNVNTMLTWIGKARCPVSAIVLGPGWSARNETVDLALALGGRIFSERRLDALMNSLVGTRRRT